MTELFQEDPQSKNKIGRALIIVLALIFLSGMVSGGCTHYSQQTKVAFFSVRKGPYTVNNNPTERNFRNGYWSERSYTNVLFGFPITLQMLQVLQSSTTSRLILGRQKCTNIMLQAFLTPKCSVIFESSAKLITSFRYSSGTTIWHITFHSS